MEQIDRLQTLAGPMHGTPFMDVTNLPAPRPARPYNTTYKAKAPSQCFQYINQAEIEDNLWYLTGQEGGLPNRKYNTAAGRQAAIWIQQKAAQYCAGRCTSQLFEHDWAQSSVIVRWNAPGSNQVVIVGAHLDSTASGDRAPGADDDGTGTVTVLEALRALLQCNWVPSVNIEFQMYAAEEVGLWGSSDIATYYSNADINVQSMLQFDMNGCCHPNSGLNRGTMYNVCTDSAFTNAALTARLRNYIDETDTLDRRDFTYGYAASDHASFARAGYPACHVKENVGYSPIHTARDDYQNIDFPYLVNFVKVAIQFADGEAGR